MSKNKFIGDGFTFPIAIDSSGSTSVSSDDANIRQCMMMILGTAPGERIKRPTFGCAIHDILFEPNTQVTAAKVEYEVKKSIVEFEPRVSNVEVVARADDNEPSRMNVTVYYTIRNSNVRTNLVYPFYLRKEGEA